MKALFKYSWAGIFLAIFGFQVLGTTLHFYDQSDCRTSTAHHDDNGTSAFKDHCKICDNLLLLHAGFDIPKAWTLATPAFEEIVHTAKPILGFESEQLQSSRQRGPPAFS